MLEKVVAGDTTDQESDRQNPLTMVAIPAHNEEVAIGTIVIKALQHADEVVVVDDGSTDATADVARVAGAHVIGHSRNLGKGMAIRTAWLYARERGAAVLILLDGDHQHDPAEIPRFVEPILHGDADVLLGIRPRGSSDMPRYRRFGKRLLDYATASALRKGMLTDSQCGYRAFSSEALDRLEPEDGGLSIESQMLIEAQEDGLRIAEVPVSVRYDVDGSNTSPMRHGIGVLGRVLSLVSEKRPLFFFGVPGFVLIGMAGFLAFLVLMTFQNTRELAVGQALLVVLFSMSGLMSIFIAVVLHAMQKAIAKQ